MSLDKYEYIIIIDDRVPNPNCNAIASLRSVTAEWVREARNGRPVRGEFRRSNLGFSDYCHICIGLLQGMLKFPKLRHQAASICQEDFHCCSGEMSSRSSFLMSSGGIWFCSLKFHCRQWTGRGQKRRDRIREESAALMVIRANGEDLLDASRKNFVLCTTTFSPALLALSLMNSFSEASLVEASLKPPTNRTYLFSWGFLAVTILQESSASASSSKRVRRGGGFSTGFPGSCPGSSL